MGRQLPVRERLMIAGVEDYWVATSKKLNVMHFPLYRTDMLHRFIIFNPNPGVWSI